MKDYPVAPDGASLNAIIVELGEAVVKHHELAFNAARVAVAEAWKCGEHLIALKDALPHGEFQPWLEKHGIEVRRAQRWMLLAREYTADQVALYDSVAEALGGLKNDKLTHLPQNGASSIEGGDAVGRPVSSPTARSATMTTDTPETAPSKPRANGAAKPNVRAMDVRALERIADRLRQAAAYDPLDSGGDAPNYREVVKLAHRDLRLLLEAA